MKARSRGRPVLDSRFQRRATTVEEDGSFRLSGRRPVLEALRAGFVKSIRISDRAHGAVITEICALAENLGVAVQRLSVVDEGNNLTQGVVAYTVPPPLLTDLRAFVKTLPDYPPPLFVMLDGIHDPHNFGAILRSAEAAAVTGVIVRLRRQAPVSHVVVKASAGAAYFVPLFGVTNLAQTLRFLADEGYWSLAATGSSQAKPYREVEWNRPLVLIVGSEGPGISQLLRKAADEHVRIPMLGRIESLNVSVATGILLHEAANARLHNNQE